MKDIPSEWIKNYIDKLLGLAGQMPEDSRMRGVMLRNADCIMNMVQGWKDTGGMETSVVVDRYQLALEKIKRDQGKVCANFEMCYHESCRSSYTSWAIANAALQGVELSS